MDFDELNAISNAFIAVSTVLGVAGALAYYFSQVTNVSLYELIVLEIVYFLAIFFITGWVRRKVKNEESD